MSAVFFAEPGGEGRAHAAPRKGAQPLGRRRGNGGVYGPCGPPYREVRHFCRTLSPPALAHRAILFETVSHFVVNELFRLDAASAADGVGDKQECSRASRDVASLNVFAHTRYTYLYPDRADPWCIPIRLSATNVVNHHETTK